MADFKMALQALGRGRVDVDVLRTQIRKLLKTRPQLADVMLLQLKQSHERQEIGQELFVSLQDYISSCSVTPPQAGTTSAGAPQTQSPEDDDEGKTQTVGTPTQAPSPARQAAIADEDEMSTEISAAIDVMGRGEAAAAASATGAAGTGPVADDWQVAAAEAEDAGKVLDVGSVIKHRFKLTGVLGQGGMGKVFKGIDLLKQEAKDKNPYVAIKLLNEDFRQHPEAFIALQRESSRQQKLAHPNIATVYDFDRVGSSGTQVFITMELMEGEPINELIKRRVRVKGGLPFEEAFPIIRGLGLALSYAHERNIVHSDFKPGNSFLCKDGTVKVLDFGIARAAKNPQAIGGDVDGEKTLFDPGKLGALTPAYASLEMLEGQDPDQRDDIYALGCVTYELLTGKHPFNKLPANTARDNKLVVAQVKGLKRRQMKALQESLAFERKDRSKTVGEFINALEGTLHWYKNPWVLAAAATVMIAVGGTPVFLKHQHKKEIDALIVEVNSKSTVRVKTVLAGFMELSAEDRRRIAEESRDAIQGYFEGQVTLVASVKFERYGFPQAENILDEARDIYPDSLWLKQFNDQIDAEKNQLLYTFNKRYLAVLEELQQGGTDPAEVQQRIEEVLGTIARIDPGHPLLEDQRPPIAYLHVAQREFAEGRLVEAMKNIKAGRALDAENASLANLELRVGRQQRVSALEQEIGPQAAGNSLQDYRSIAPQVLELASLSPNSEVLARLSGGISKAAEASLQKVLSSGARTDAEQLAAEFGGLLSSLKLGGDLSRIKLAHLTGEARETAIRELVGGSQQEIDRLLADAQPGDTAWEAGILANLQQLSSLLPPGEQLLQDINAQVASAYVPQIDDAADDNRFEEARNLLQSITNIVGAAQPALQQAQQRVATLEAEFQAAENRRALEAEIAGRKEDVLAQLGGLDIASAVENITFLQTNLASDDVFLVTLNERLERAYIRRAAQAAGQQRYEDALKEIAAGRKQLPDSASLAQLEREYTRDFKATRMDGVVQRLLEAPDGVELSRLLQARQEDLDWLQEQFPQRYSELQDDASSRFGQEIGRLREFNDTGARLLATAAVTLFPDVGALQSLKQSLEEQPWEGLDDANAALSEGRLSAVRDMVALAPVGNAELTGLRTTLEERVTQAGQLYGSFQQTRGAAGDDAAALRQSREHLQQALSLWSDNPEYLSILQELDTQIRKASTSRIIEKEEDFSAPQEPTNAAAGGTTSTPDPGAKAGSVAEGADAGGQPGTPDGATSSPDKVAVVQPLAAPWKPIASERPCEVRLAGHGKRAKAICYDIIGGKSARGPLLVVIPVGGPAPQGFAISKYEVSVNDYNKYCFFSKVCSPLQLDKDYPVVNLSIGQVEQYAVWLSERTGNSYRLPTTEEWIYAAEAGGKQPRKDFNCSVVLGEKKLKGTGLVSVKSGKSNGWGLSNYIGNAQEWVRDGGALNVRGGAYQDPLSNCKISLSREHDGTPDAQTGFRLIREETG